MRYASLIVVLLVATTLGGCDGGVLDPKGPVALAERQILLNATGIMLAIVIPVVIATLGFAFWFRASNERARYRPDFIYSGRIEMLVWSIPLMTVLLVGTVAWIGAYDLDPPKPIPSSTKPLKIQVVSLDWKWLFIYPEQGIASVNHLTIPVGTPVSFELTSSGVMNSFFVPQLAGQIYTMAGMVTRLNLRADYSGHDFRVWTRNGHRWEFRLRTLGPRQPGNKPANGLRLPSLSLARGNLSIAQCRRRGAG